MWVLLSALAVGVLLEVYSYRSTLFVDGVGYSVRSNTCLKHARQRVYSGLKSGVYREYTSYSQQTSR